MAFSATQLRLLTDRLVADGMNEWTYDDTADIATVVAAGYITGVGPTKGMAVGDKVTYRQFDSLTTKATLISVSVHYVTAISATTGAVTLTAGGENRPVIEDALAVTLTAGQSGGLVVFDKLDGAVITLPAPEPGLFFDFVVDTASTSVGDKVITNDAAVFIKGTVLQMTAAGAANVLDTANGSTHRAVTMNGTTTGGVVGSRFRLTCRSATIWEVEGLIIASGLVATSFTTS